MHEAENKEHIIKESEKVTQLCIALADIKAHVGHLESSLLNGGIAFDLFSGPLIC